MPETFLNPCVAPDGYSDTVFLRSVQSGVCSVSNTPQELTAMASPKAIASLQVTADSSMAGYHLDFTPEEMVRRYGNPAAYLEKVTAAVEFNLSQGFLLAEDALRVLAEARSVRFEG